MKLPNTLAAAQAEIIELRRRMKELERQATVDLLTGLLNRRAGEDALVRTEQYFNRKKGEYHILMLDLDYFKRVNDTPEWGGHANGDRVLAHMGRLIKSMKRSYDCAIRWGGEEFVIIVAEDDEGSWVVADKLMQAIREDITADPDGEVPMTTSIGIGRTVEEADKALYRAKEKRNTICGYEDEIKYA